MMMLVEEGKLRLDEPVDRLLPELAKRKVLKDPTGPLDDVRDSSRPITVRDLLTVPNGHRPDTVMPAFRRARRSRRRLRGANRTGTDRRRLHETTGCAAAHHQPRRAVPVQHVVDGDGSPDITCVGHALRAVSGDADFQTARHGRYGLLGARAKRCSTCCDLSQWTNARDASPEAKPGGCQRRRCFHPEPAASSPPSMTI